MKLNHFFNEDQVLFLENKEKQLVIKEMIKKLEELGKIKNTPRYYAQVIHRESLENTGIGHYVAIPHARTESVTEFNTLFGIAAEGIEYQSYDKKPVKYLLLSIFPTTQSTKYLFLVSMIAKIFSQKNHQEKLNKASSPQEVYAILSSYADQYFSSISEKQPITLDHSANLAGVPTSDLDLLIRLDRLYKYYESDPSDESTMTKINELRKLIDNRSLSYYERMRKKSNTPFAIVEKNACSGCNMNIPPIDMNEIMERKKISICTYCGRFLIHI
jgi:mannitol/fructose-specific phosphotransferase system IIA component (Ntr-type)